MTLLSANDRFEILDLCSRYNRCLDNSDEDGLMDCWARSGISYEDPKGKFSSWDQLKKHIGRELHGAGTPGRKRSILFNIVIRDGESVDTAYVDSEYIVIDSTTLQIAEAGSFESDRVTRTSMGWRFLRRSQRPDLRAKTGTATPPGREAHPH